MPWWKLALCRLILLLEFIPAYRRTRRINPKTKDLDPVQWRFMWRGLWGFHLLSRLGWLWPYLDSLTWSAWSTDELHLPDLSDDESQPE